MSEILRHDFRGDLEIRGDGRTVVGLAVPYDTPTVIRENGVVYDEVFRHGAFAQTIEQRAERVKFLLNHNRQALPLGRALSLREDAAGLVGEFRVSATRAGDEALELIRDGALDGLSVGFVPVKDRGTPESGFVERLESKLIEVSGVAFPAYEGALIAGVRHEIVGPDQAEQVTPDQSDGDNPDQVVDPTYAARRRLRIQLNRST